MINEARYAQLKRRIEIDMMRLDEELIGMPVLVEEISEMTAKALLTRSAAENRLKVVIAEAADEIRKEGEKKPAEKQIESEVLLDAQVQDSTLELDEAKYEYAMWQGLMDAARTKSSALKTVSELIISGYITPDTIYAQRRRELNANRRAKIEKE